MKIDVLKVITGVKKEPIKVNDDVLTIKLALLMALVQPNPDAQGVSPEEALKTRRLFDKIDTAEGEIELKSEDVVKLKHIVAKRLSEYVAGSVIAALEPEEVAQG